MVSAGISAKQRQGEAAGRRITDLFPLQKRLVAVRAGPAPHSRPCGRIESGMEKMLDIPKDRKRIPPIRLCLMLAAVVLLFLVAETRAAGIF
jgi:hypothetical protein